MNTKLYIYKSRVRN